ncbi:hypothetical protein [Teredinibacter sp. KSP-S5-2]|uniref:hypothetical protein n=1 Tax=Teredinibacter sp. KSP-S5-2 TaxID=3034506 RepID=UPI00293418B1|nr:hypothetical protein [Teredinibacter sp. KSP-S5-2]WNO09979.1 hypothetical protein P5V12_02220 [Teredinibacter sp. KSP-S5-2]
MRKIEMKAFSLITLVLLLSGCIPIRIVDVPPDLNSCSNLGWVESNKVDSIRARKQLDKKVESLGGNLLYLISMQENTNKEKKSVQRGIAYKCS